MLGRDIMRAAPPVPESVVSASGEVLYTGAEIGRGR